MNTEATGAKTGRSKVNARVAIWAFKIGAGVVIPLYVFFWLAGRLDWGRGWAYIGLLTVLHSASTVYLWRRSPEMLRRRSKIGKGTKKWDVVWLAAFGTSHIATCCVGALDAGRSVGSVMPDWLWAVGAGLYLAFVLVITWAMAVNPHFEKTVRIQHDRDHRVIDTGPYRFVRHPGYAAVLAGFTLGTPLLLGSWWAFVPAFVTLILVMVRTALEDRVLHEELPGYAEYAGRVRRRLVPGLW